MKTVLLLLKYEGLTSLRVLYRYRMHNPVIASSRFQSFDEEKLRWISFWTGNGNKPILFIAQVLQNLHNVIIEVHAYKLLRLKQLNIKQSDSSYYVGLPVFWLSLVMAK